MSTEVKLVNNAIFAPKGADQDPDKVKCWSGRAISWLNANDTARALLNPNWDKAKGAKCVALGVTAPIRVVARFVIGTAAAFFGGVAGFIWHSAAVVWDSGKRVKHLKSAGADFLRAIPLVSIATGIHYACAPGSFFATGGENKSFVSDHRMGKEAPKRSRHPLKTDVMIAGGVVAVAGLILMCCAGGGDFGGGGHDHVVSNTFGDMAGAAANIGGPGSSKARKEVRQDS